MIRIARPATWPRNLKKNCDRQTEEDRAAYDACPSDYISGVKRFLWRSYYSFKPVRKLLVDMHHSKCCYCERKLPAGELEVEHFRPKGGVRQDLDQKVDELPGYYWLVYHWDNLLLACSTCNSRHKWTFFPLSNPTERARCHHDDVAKEQLLFVDPVEQDPRLHIRFDRENPFDLTPVGRTSITGFGLRSDELMEQRNRTIEDIDARIAILGGAVRNPKDAQLKAKARLARQFIEVAKQPDAEFSSMVIDYLTPFGL